MPLVRFDLAQRRNTQALPKVAHWAQFITGEL